MVWSWVHDQVHLAGWRGVSTSRPWCQVIWSAAMPHGSKSITGVSAEPGGKALRPVATDFGSSDPSADRAVSTPRRSQTHDLRLDGQIKELG